MAAKNVQDVRRAMGKPMTPATSTRVKRKKNAPDPRNPKGERVLIVKDGRRRVFEWRPWE